MTFSISKIVVNSVDDKVVSMNWTYENPEGKLGNTWELLKPYGDTPLADCTEPVLVKWLEEQLPTTTAEFDRQIAKRNADQAASATLKVYTPQEKRSPIDDAAVAAAKEAAAKEIAAKLEAAKEVAGQPSTMPAPIDETPDQPATADLKSKRRR